jgi:hypothetical protein
MKRLIASLIYILAFSSAYALSAFLFNVDIEYDYYSDNSYVVCSYSFTWATESGTMTGFYYSFPENTEVIPDQSFALINQARKVGVILTYYGNQYDIDLENNIRFSGRCDYVIKCRIPKLDTSHIVVSMNQFDCRVEKLTITAIMDHLVEGYNRKVEIYPEGKYMEVPIDRYGILIDGIRIEMDNIQPLNVVIMNISTEAI